MRSSLGIPIILISSPPPHLPVLSYFCYALLYFQEGQTALDLSRNDDMEELLITLKRYRPGPTPLVACPAILWCGLIWSDTMRCISPSSPYTLLMKLKTDLITPTTSAQLLWPSPLLSFHFLTITHSHLTDLCLPILETSGDLFLRSGVSCTDILSSPHYVFQHHGMVMIKLDSSRWISTNEDVSVN